MSRSTVKRVSDLPSSAGIGDEYYVRETGNTYAWTGTDFQNLGDFSEPATKDVAVERVRAQSLEYVQKVRVQLTDAQIKALPTTPIEIAPAPGANKIIVPIFLAASGEGTFAHPYANINADGYMVLGNDTPLDILYVAVNDSGAGAIVLNSFLNGSADMLLVGGVAYNQSFLQGWGIIPNDVPKVAVINKALQLSVNNNGSGNFTGGNAGNKIRLTLHYIVVDL